MLRTGQRILSQAGTDADQLGHALSQLHSALERHFRQSLAANQQVPWETRSRLSQAQDMNRIELIDLMMRYGGLSGSAAETIRRFNRVRNAIQHDNQVYQGSRQNVEQYAKLAESIIRGPERVFAGAAYPDDLFAATMGALNRPASPKSETPPGGAPSAAPPHLADTPAHAISQPPTSAAARPASLPDRGRSPVHNARGQHGGTQFSTLLIIVLIVALAMLLYTTVPREPSQPLRPTPTLGLPAS